MVASKYTQDDQAALWNGPGGRAWVEAQEVLDGMFAPFERLLVATIPPGSRERLLDVGCGTGGTTLAAARRLGPEGHCTGIDISQPLIRAAQARAERDGVDATFVQADAQTYSFNSQSFDRIISRFGVMFFDDPVTAFANLRSAACRDAELRFLAWRSADDNPFMTTAERAAAPLLPDLPVRQPGRPGQFAFAERDHIISILEKSGWTGINVEPVDLQCTLRRSELDHYLRWLGPVGRLLQDVDDQTRTRIIETVRSAFDPFVVGQQVRFVGSCWIATANPRSAAAYSLPERRSAPEIPSA